MYDFIFANPLVQILNIIIKHYVMRMNFNRIALLLGALSLCVYSCKEEEDPVVQAPTRKVEISNDGALPGLFSVSESQQVQFSRGNLYTRTQDGFCFSVFQTDVEKNGYFLGSSSNNWCADSPVKNGGGKAGIWRTMTKDEMSYLLNDRTNAASLCGVATIAGTRGLMLLPDAGNESAIDFKPMSTSWSDNSYSLKEWYELEAAGAVFLPAAGSMFPQRDSTDVSGLNSFGVYWTSTSSSSSSYVLSFSDANFYFEAGDIYHANAVRLVKNE